MAKHVFENYCVDFNEILSVPNISSILRAVEKQSKLEEAKLRVDIANYKDYGEDESCPIYFGMFVEWFAKHFLNHWGHLFSVMDVTMLDEVSSDKVDNGVDGRAVTSKQKKGGHRVLAKEGSPVYIQVKGTLNFNKEHKANDGSRLPNFMMHALSCAVKSGHAYTSRYILFTTARGIHYRLKTMSNDMMEVVGIEIIKKLVNGNVSFLNRLRESISLPPLPLPKQDMDQEALHNSRIAADEGHYLYLLTAEEKELVEEKRLHDLPPP